MRPLQLIISAFGPYKDKVEIDLERLGSRGVYLIRGDTGAGKTTIFDAITFALFGEASGHNREKSMLRSKYADPKTTTFVDLTFSHAGKTYRVIRNPAYERPKLTGSGTTKQPAKATLEFPDSRPAITREREVTRVIETEILGITRDQFLQVAMIAQGDFEKLLVAKTDERLPIFRTLFKTDNYNRLQGALRERAQALRSDLAASLQALRQDVSALQCSQDHQLYGQVSAAKEDEHPGSEVLGLAGRLIAEDEAYLEELNASFEDLNNEIMALTSKISLAEKQENDLRRLRELEAEDRSKSAALEQARKRFDAERARKGESSGLTQTIERIRTQLPEYARLEALKRQERALEEKVRELLGQLRRDEQAVLDLQTQLDALQQERSGLDGAHERKAELGQRLIQVGHDIDAQQTLVAAIESFVRTQGAFAKATDEREKAGIELGTLEAEEPQIKEFSNTVSRIEHEMGSVEELERTRKSLDEANREHAETQGLLERRTRELEEAQATLDASKGQRSELMDAAAQLETVRAQLERHQARAEMLTKRHDDLLSYRKLAREIEADGARLVQADEDLKIAQDKQEACRGFAERIGRIDSELANYDARAQCEAELAESKARLGDLEGESSHTMAELTDKERAFAASQAERGNLLGAQADLERARQSMDKAQGRSVDLLELVADVDGLEKERARQVELQSVYLAREDEAHRLLVTYEELHKAYFDEQAGILAERLEEGEPCPVCGSTTHPHLAHLSDKAPSEEELKRAQDKSDRARSEAERASQEAKSQGAVVATKEEAIQRRAEGLMGACALTELKERLLRERAKNEREIEDAASEVRRQEVRALRAQELDKAIEALEADLKRLREDRLRIDTERASYVARIKELEGRTFDLSYPDKEAALADRQRMRGSIEDAERFLEAASRSRAEIQRRIDDLAGRLSQSRSQLEQVCDLGDVEAAIKGTEDELSRTNEELVATSEQLRLQDERLQRFEQLRAVIERQEHELARARESKATCESDLARLEEQTHQLSARARSLEASLLFCDRQEAQAHRADLMAKIDAHKRALEHAQGVCADLDGELSRLKGILSEASSRLSADIDVDRSEEALASTQSGLERLCQERESLEGELELVTHKVERRAELDELIPKKSGALHEVQDGKRKRETELATNRTSLDEKKAQVTEVSSRLPYSDQGEAEAELRRLGDLRAEMERAYEEAEAAVRDLKEDASTRAGKIEDLRHHISEAGELDKGALTRRRQDLMAKSQETRDRQTSVYARCNANKRALKRIDEDLRKTDAYKNEYTMVNVLSETANGNLTGRDKVMLETYVQMTYFERVVRRANVRLMKMTNNQYEFQRQRETATKRSQIGLELEVIDHYNATTRSVRTLSGGESFMASLSLALGLSDEIQSSVGGIRLETMFVDEGFGSLDDNALRQAIAALQGLSEGNRLVGIISHVSELAERIDRQVVVTKGVAGSAVEVVV